MGKQPSGPSTLTSKFEVTVSILQSIYMVSSLCRHDIRSPEEGSDIQ